jgi:hypothetical protein
MTHEQGVNEEWPLSFRLVDVVGKIKDDGEDEGDEDEGKKMTSVEVEVAADPSSNPWRDPPVIQTSKEWCPTRFHQLTRCW